MGGDGGGACACGAELGHVWDDEIGRERVFVCGWFGFDRGSRSLKHVAVGQCHNVALTIFAQHDKVGYFKVVAAGTCAARGGLTGNV